MELDRGPYQGQLSQTQAQENDIDPRLQEGSSSSAPYPPAPATNSIVTSFAPRPHPPAAPFQVPPQQQQQHQHQYASAPQWAQEGYNAFYGPSDQHQHARAPPSITHLPHHTSHVYQTYQDATGAPIQHLQTSTAETTDSKRSRACEACRNLKVKCEPDPAAPKCKRCVKANRNCVITAPSRKRQKKSDNRVVDLERKIDALTQRLNSTKAGNVSGSEDGNDGEVITPPIDSTGDTDFRQTINQSNPHEKNQKRNHAEYQDNGYPPHNVSLAPAVTNQLDPSTIPHTKAESNVGPVLTSGISHREDIGGDKPSPSRRIDVISRGILGVEAAAELLNHYIQNMAPHMPIVIFPKATALEMIRESRPLLFLAILSVASSERHPVVHHVLHKELLRSLSQRIICGESKSLEVLQTLQVATIWYVPEPDRESNYYQFVHMASGIAIDLGINKKQGKKRSKLSVLQHSPPTIDSESTECRRAWIGCYLLYSSISMGMRRPNLIRKDGYLQECLTQLQHQADGVESDVTLCQLAYLQTLADDLSEQILPDAYLPMSEAKARNAHKAFEKEMKYWSEQGHNRKGSLLLNLVFNVINLYMHELVMQHVASFEPAKSSSRSRGKNQPLPSTPTQASSLSIAVPSTIGILDAFSKFSSQEILTLPTFHFAQVAHASVSLIKLYFVGQADSDVSKHAPIGVAMVEEDLNRLIESLRSTGGSSLTIQTFLKMIVILQTLFRENKDSSIATIKARYRGIPSLKATQMLDLEEPQPTPQQRTAAPKSEESSDGALQILSAVAMGNTHTDGHSTGEGRTDAAAGVQSVDEGEMAAMGQLIGEGDMGFMSDEGFLGIMQRMWARGK